MGSRHTGLAAWATASTAGVGETGFPVHPATPAPAKTGGDDHPSSPAHTGASSRVLRRRTGSSGSHQACRPGPARRLAPLLFLPGKGICLPQRPLVSRRPEDRAVDTDSRVEGAGLTAYGGCHEILSFGGSGFKPAWHPGWQRYLSQAERRHGGSSGWVSRADPSPKPFAHCHSGWCANARHLEPSALHQQF